MLDLHHSIFVDRSDRGSVFRVHVPDQVHIRHKHFQ